MGAEYTHCDMTHSDIINLWPTLSDFATDLGVKYGTAKAMRRRSSIPPEHWCRVVAKAEGRELAAVTLDSLAHAIALEAAE